MKTSRVFGLGALAIAFVGCSAEQGSWEESEGSQQQAVLRPLPGRVEAEQFERFADADAAHSGNCGTGAVDQEVTTDAGGGCNVAYTQAGEWLEYDLSIANGGRFDFTFRLASAVANRTASVRLDGVLIGQVTAPSAGWQAFADRTINNVSVAAGNHVLRVTFDTADVNFNYFQAAQIGGTGRNIANNLEAEANDGQTGLQFEACTEGGQNASFIHVNDSVQWNVAVPNTGNYTVTVRSATWAATSVKLQVRRRGQGDAQPALVVDGWREPVPNLAELHDPRHRAHSRPTQLEAGVHGREPEPELREGHGGEHDCVLVPARIEAEAYTAFNDSTLGNQGGACDRGDSVDKEATTDQSGVCSVGWTTPGEWLEYDIQSSTAQTVSIVSRVASALVGKRFHVTLDGATIGGPQTAPSAGWQAFADSTISGISVSAGAHKLRVVFDDGDVNFNYLNVTASAAPTCVNNDPQGSTSLGLSRADIRSAKLVRSDVRAGRQARFRRQRAGRRLPRRAELDSAGAPLRLSLAPRQRGQRHSVQLVRPDVHHERLRYARGQPRPTLAPAVPRLREQALLFSRSRHEAERLHGPDPESWSRRGPVPQRDHGRRE